MTKNSQVKLLLGKMPYYPKITRKYRYTNQIKDRAWAILSDYVRMRDFLIYKKCISSGNEIQNWRNCDAGHYISMGGHGALIGFYDMNIHAQSKHDNHLSSMHTGARFRDELVRRYGTDIVKHLDSIKDKTVKADDFFFIGKIKEIYEKFSALMDKYPNCDYPDYMMHVDKSYTK